MPDQNSIGDPAGSMTATLSTTAAPGQNPSDFDSDFLTRSNDSNFLAMSNDSNFLAMSNDSNFLAMSNDSNFLAMSNDSNFLAMSNDSNFLAMSNDSKFLAMTNSTTQHPILSGYDLPVYGLDNGQFYVIHIAALSCIFVSFCCALTTFICSFRSHRRPFFLWSQSDRIVVYLAVCDGLFNVSHSLDHLHYAIQRGHVTPPALCAFYGFMLSEFISAQNLLVFITAINACLLVHRHKPLPFGTNDWRLLLATFGTPAVFGFVVAALSGFGPTGTFCYFDAVNGGVANILFTSTALGVVLVSCAALYVFTWLQIYREARRNEKVLGRSQLSASVLVAAKTCLLLVAAFFVQWWAMALYGTWQLVQPPPQLLFQFVTTFSNTGGILNFIVFCIIYRRRKARADASKSDSATGRSGGSSQDII